MSIFSLLQKDPASIYQTSWRSLRKVFAESACDGHCDSSCKGEASPSISWLWTQELIRAYILGGSRFLHRAAYTILQLGRHQCPLVIKLSNARVAGLPAAPRKTTGDRGPPAVTLIALLAVLRTLRIASTLLLRSDRPRKWAESRENNEHCDRPDLSPASSLQLPGSVLKQQPHD